MKNWLRSPFLHFILIGGAIFLLYDIITRESNHPEGYDIFISKYHQEKIASTYQRNFGSLPNTNEMNQLLDAEIQSEIYYREALRIGLDENDEIIRRRLKQKYEFLERDKEPLETPKEQELLEYYEKHKERYKAPEEFSFEHVYFSPDTRKDPNKDAQLYIDQIKSTPTLKGMDVFHISSPKFNKTVDEIRQEFGLTFAESIADLEPGQDLFAVQSGFGYHVIRITDKKQSKYLSFSDISEKIRLDYNNEFLDNKNKENYNSLRKHYRIEIEK